jgi:LysM repeat protein
MKFTRFSTLLLLVFTFFLISQVALAQGDIPQESYYLVQEGDSLWGIATRFGVTLDELQAANNISDPRQLTSGMQLVIPGLEGVSGLVGTHDVRYGETLESISRDYGLSTRTLAQANRLIRCTDYIYDPSLNVDPATVDPAVTKPEAELRESCS